MRLGATNVHRRNPANAIGNQMRASELKSAGRKGRELNNPGGIEFAAAVFAVVVTATVTVSAGVALELATYAFRESLVLIAQLAFGAFVLHEK
jgi:hypothetical protein